MIMIMIIIVTADSKDQRYKNHDNFDIQVKSKGVS